MIRLPMLFIQQSVDALSNQTIFEFIEFNPNLFS